jgi:hypothetical protein
MLSGLLPRSSRRMLPPLSRAGGAGAGALCCGGGATTTGAAGAGVERTIGAAGCGAGVDRTIGAAGCGAGVDRTIGAAGCGAGAERTTGATDIGTGEGCGRVDERCVPDDGGGTYACCGCAGVGAAMPGRGAARLSLRIAGVAPGTAVGDDVVPGCANGRVGGALVMPPPEPGATVDGACRTSGAVDVGGGVPDRGSAMPGAAGVTDDGDGVADRVNGAPGIAADGVDRGNVPTPPGAVEGRDVVG